MDGRHEAMIVGTQQKSHGLSRRPPHGAGAGGWWLLLLVLVSACRGSWTPTTIEPTTSLQWPYTPSAAKVTYERSLTGIERKRGPGSVFQSILLGNREDALNSFILPVAVATARDGRIAVADIGRNSVHLYVPEEAHYTQLTGSKRDKLTSPVGVTFDESSTLYVSDSGGRVFAFEPDGKLRFVVKQAGGRPLLRPTGIAYNPRKQAFYVVDTLAHTVNAFSREGAFLFSFGTRGDGESAFNFPTHITCASSGELYVTDALNFRIAIFDENGHALGTFGRQGDGSGDFAMPKGVAVDGDGTVYVVDALFDNVQLFNRAGEFLLTLGGRGTALGEFWLPSGAFISDRDELYVCDTYNHRVQVFRIVRSNVDAAS